MGEPPRERANEAISEANEAVARHNELFQQTRSTYQDVKQRIESSGGEGGEEAFQEEKERIAEARSTLEEARSHLEDARSSLEDVQDIDELDPAVSEYARTLSEAMDAQLDAETQEIQFYDLLEEDPILEDNRDEARELLSEAGDNYQRAESSYEEAQEIANSNPDVLDPTSGGQDNPPEGGSN